MHFGLWLILGVVLIVLEIVIPSFVVIWFGIAALLTGIVACWVTDLTMQCAVFALLSATSFAVGWFGFLKNSASRSQAGQGKESVQGERGIVSFVKPGDFPAARSAFPWRCLVPTSGNSWRMNPWPWGSGARSWMCWGRS
jgi:membrane protein implicated in regulation of membrane protease activity